MDRTGRHVSRIPRSLALAIRLCVAPVIASASGCKGGDQQQAPREQPPAPVEVAQVEAGELVDEWVFVGEVRSLRSAQLALGAGGEVVMIEVREGDRVDAGALLVEIDKRQAKARLSAAVSSRRESERELEQARREAERAAKLGSQVLASEEIEQEAVRADTLEARKRRLAAEIQAARAQLSDYQLAAPFAGVIAARHVDLGQWVDPGQTVVELVSTEEVEVLVDVRPELAPHISVGGQAVLRAAGGLSGVGTSAGAEPSEVNAEVLGLVPSLDPSTRTLKVRLRALEARRWLLPGAPVDVGFPVRFSTAAGSGVIVPRDALVLGAVDTRVITVVEGQARPVVVEVRASAGDKVIVKAEGLEAGAIVVTRGNERLRPAQAVRVIEADAGGAGEEEPAA